MITTTYDLNLQPGGLPITIPVSQYDVNSRTLTFNLITTEGSLSLPSGTQAEIRGTKPDGNGFSYLASISGTTVTVTITEQMTAVGGKTRCELVLFKGTPSSSSYQQLASANFILAVERAALDKDTLTSSSEIRQLVNVMDNSAAIIAAGQQADDAARRIEALSQSAHVSASQAEQSAREAQEALSTVGPLVRDSASYLRTLADDSVAELNLEHQANMREMRQAAAQNAQDQAETHTEQMEELHDAHTAALREWREEYSEDVNELRELKSDTVRTVRETGEAQTQELNDTHAANMEEMRSTHRSNMSDLDAEYQADIEALTAAIEEALVSITARHNESLDSLQSEYDADIHQISIKLSEILAIKTRADNIAQQSMEAHAATDLIAKQALEKATNAENESAETAAFLDRVNDLINMLQVTMGAKVDGAFDENGYLYLTSGDEVVVGPLGPFAGGGGGGGGSGGNNATITIENTSGWMSKTISQDDSCPVSFVWSSEENGLATGNGSLKISISNSQKAIIDVAQGSITVDIAPYLNSGANTVALTVTDIYGNNRTIRLTVTKVTLTLESQFDSSVPYAGPISFAYTPSGNITKTVYFILDGITIGTATTSVSGRQQSFTIPQQVHGRHTFRVYFEAEINGQIVRSNELYFELICLDPMSQDPIISSAFRQSEAKQYSSVHVDYTVYDPNSMTADVVISVDGETVSTLTVDRTSQVFTYRAAVLGEHTITITTGSTFRSFPINVVDSGITVEAETDSLALFLSSYGRSNTEANRSVWKSGSIEAVLTGFNYTSDAWQRDRENNTVMRVTGDARILIPYLLFGSDFRGTGKTIELEFATRNVMNYDAVILSCLSEGRGLSMTAQSIKLSSEQEEISTQFKEDEHVRVSFVIEKRTENRLIYCYINGICSGAVQYPANDDFAQATPVGISIGSNDCTIDIYNIRVYDNDLTRHQIVNNWIADTQDVEVMLERYYRNDVYDEYGEITIDKLPNDLPYLVIEAAELPQYKGDKKTVSGRYVDPANPSRNFTFTGAQWDVQGTSSQYYERKNYKGKFKGGFDLANGTNAKKYQLTEGTIPISTLCFKADVASSEGANNVELVRLYDFACPYKTPAQVLDPRVRQGIDGFPIVVFWDNGTETVFIGKLTLPM